MTAQPPMPPWHRTKIVCTLGPATDPPGVVEKLIHTGMDVARLNMSHGDHAGHARRIRQVRTAARQAGQPVAVLIDLPGPKFRIGDLPEGARELQPESDVTLAAPGHPGDLPVRHAELLEVLRPGESVYLADGAIKLQVRTTAAGQVGCRVLTGGTVRSGSGINAPDSTFSALIPTEDDRRHIAFAVAQEAEWIGVSFVQTVDDLVRVRALLPAGSPPHLMAKIEKRRALAELGAIVDAADGVMVARGDLGVETDLAEIPLVQKRIIALANARGRPVVTATQMLESMVGQEQPTRAEVTDVANAILDGTDAVMLSAETAIGRFPVAAVDILRRVLTATEAEYGARMAHDRLRASGPESADDPISFVACQLAARLDARAILIPAAEVATALAIARLRPKAPLLVFAGPENVCRSLAVAWGVAPLPAGAATDAPACLARARRWLFERDLARPGDAAVVLSASGSGNEVSDTLQVVRLAGEG
jgi:pyruvate kinase